MFFVKNGMILLMQMIEKNSKENLAPSSEMSISLIGLRAENKKLTCENEALKKQIDWFKQQFKLASQRHFGKSSEKTASFNLSFFDEAMTGNLAATTDTPVTETVTYKRKKKSTGRHFDVSKFPKEQVIHDLSAEEKICGCGKALEKAGEDISTQVDHIPETFKVIEHITLKYCCRLCETIQSAKKPEVALPKCMATASLVAEVVIKKYEQHLPLYRQSKIFAQLGAVIPDNTLGNWVMSAAEALEPLGVAARKQILKVRVLQADETKVKTLKPNKQGYLWGYHGCDPGNRFIVFEYHATRGGHIPNEMLKDFVGILQTDGYIGYAALRSKPKVVAVGCWDHARRKFMDVIKAGDKEKKGKAAQIVMLINQLYEIEEATDGMSFAERKAHRQAYSKSVLDTLREEVSKIHALPKSLLGVAVTYLTLQWPYLIEYINHGEVPISTCWIENQIRPFAVGRRNWLFTGTPESANKAALLYSLIQSCKMNDINARAYLEYVLNQAHRMRRGEVDATSLLPQFIDKSIF